MFRKIFIIIQLVVVCGFVSCTKEEDPNAPLQGSMTGKIRLADEFGVLLSDHGAMIISSTNDLKGASNTAGSFLLYGLDDGNHDITFAKFGFGSYKRFGIPITNPGNTTLTGIDTLGMLSTSVITGLTAVLNSADSTYSFNCSIAPVPDATNQRGIRLFFSKNALLSNNDYEYTPGQKWMATGANGSITNFSALNFFNNGFNRGDTVYVVAYGESFYSNIYIDPTSGKKVFPNVNAAHPSNSAHFILQ